MSIVKYQEHGLDLACRLEDGQAWMTYEQVAELFGVDESVVGKHARSIISEEELPGSTTAQYAVVQTEGNRSVSREVRHLNQDMVLHIGYRVRSDRGSEFRRWATMVLKGEAAPLTRVPSSDPLVAQAEAALALTQTALTITKEFVRLRDEQESIKLAQAQVEDRVLQLEEHRQPDPEFFTIMAWAKLIGMRLTLPRAAGLGRRASNMSERLGYSMGTALDPRFGTVHTYHVDILEQIMGARE
jgi:hypothetical protein